jgi:hypothetical protein
VIGGSVRRRIVSLLAASSAVWPGVASACAVCFSGRTDETRVAFGLTTAFMTLLPLIVIASVVWWLRRRARALAPIEAAAPIEARRELSAYSGTSIR